MYLSVLCPTREDAICDHKTKGSMISTRRLSESQTVPCEDYICVTCCLLPTFNFVTVFHIFVKSGHILSSLVGQINGLFFRGGGLDNCHPSQIQLCSASHMAAVDIKDYKSFLIS